MQLGIDNVRVKKEKKKEFNVDIREVNMRENLDTREIKYENAYRSNPPESSVYSLRQGSQSVLMNS